MIKTLVLIFILLTKLIFAQQKIVFEDSCINVNVDYKIIPFNSYTFNVPNNLFNLNYPLLIDSDSVFDKFVNGFKNRQIRQAKKEINFSQNSLLLIPILKRCNCDELSELIFNKRNLIHTTHYHSLSYGIEIPQNQSFIIPKKYLKYIEKFYSCEVVFKTRS